MENKVDFKEIAQYCKEQYEQQCNKCAYKTSYGIYYVAITAEGKMMVSQTPHILSNAERCFLIHRWSEKAVTCWYSTYAIQSINADGEVSKGNLDDEYSISISAERYNVWEKINLLRRGEHLYSCSLWENGRLALEQKLVYVWDLYQLCKTNSKTLYESKLLCNMAEQKETIKKLEDELDESSIRVKYLEEMNKEHQNMLDRILAAIKEHKEA